MATHHEASIFSAQSVGVPKDGRDRKNSIVQPDTSPGFSEKESDTLAPKNATSTNGPFKMKAAPTFSDNARRLISEKAKNFKTQVNPPGGFDETPLPDVPAGFTLKFTFRRGKNLPAADLHTGSSDPYIKAALFTNPPNLLKRHKEDPDLVHRTRPVRKSLNPEWNEEWIVANVPASGFKLKCRLYDEDYPAKDDRLGNVTIEVPHVSEDWSQYASGCAFRVKKRSGDKVIYCLKAFFSIFNLTPITPTLWLAIDVLGKSEPPHGKMYTVGPTGWVKHFSPMIGRMIGTKVNRHEGDDVRTSQDSGRRTRKYDFQANEMQLAGPVPPQMYHRYVEFRPLIGLMFSRSGIRGTLLSSLLHKQHRRVYNFDHSTEYGSFEPCSEEAALQLLRMAHFDDGCRIFTYVLTLDGVLRFTETGKEFGIDMLSKHSMHSDVETYIACSGEFFIRREEPEHDRAAHSNRRHQGTTGSGDDNEPCKPRMSPGTESSSKSLPSNGSEAPDSVGAEGDESLGKPDDAPANPHREQSTQSSGLMRSLRTGGHIFSHSFSRHNTSSTDARTLDPALYRLHIDNESGTYRPDKSILPDLKEYLEFQFPGLQISVHDCNDEELKKLKEEQCELKKSKGVRINMVLNRSPSSSSVSSSDESRLDRMEADESGGNVEKSRSLVRNLRKGKEKAVQALI